MAYSDIILADNPSGYWKMDESTGNLVDSSGNGNTATVNTAPTYGQPPGIAGFGTSIEFDAANEYFDTSGAYFTSVTDVSVEFWFKTSSATTQMDVFDTSASGSAGLMMTVGGDGITASAGRIGIGLNTASNWVGKYTNTAFNDGKWHHVVGVLDGTGAGVTSAQFKIYVDGIDQACTDTAFSNSHTTPFTSSFARIGANQYGGSTQYVGHLDEMATYESALTHEQIRNHYAAGKGHDLTTYEGQVLTDDPIVYYKLDDTTGVTATDSSGNSNDGTYTTAPTWEDPGLISVGNSAKYTNTTDRLSTPNSLITAFPFTIEGWINVSSFSSTVGFCNTHGDVSNYRGINAYINTSALFSLTYGDGSGDGTGDRRTWRANGFTFQTNTTYHIALVVNGHEDAELYINGVEEALTYSSGTGASTSLASGYPAEFGNPQDPSSAAIAKDHVDELALYTHALTAHAIKSHYIVGQHKYAQKVLADNPIAYWQLDETSGTTAYDTIGNTDLTIANTPTLGSVPLIREGASIDFDRATSEYIELGASDYRSSDSLGSIEAWIKTGYTADHQTIFASADEASSNQLTLGILSTGELYIYSRNGTTERGVKTTITTINNGDTHHVVATSDGTTWTLYVDGVSQSLTITHTSNDGNWFADVPNRDNVSIARLNRNGSATDYFDGQIDDVSLYDYELTAAQVTTHYEAGLGIHDPYSEAVNALNPVGYWRLGEPSGTVCYDSSGAGNDLTYYNTPTLDSDGLISGLDSAVYFLDSQTEYAEANIANFRSSDTQGAVEFWYSSTNTGDQDCIFQSGDNGSFYQLYFQQRSGGYIAVGAYAGSDNQYRTTTGGFNDGNPHHVVINSDGSAWSIWIDGHEQALTAVQGSNTGQWFGDIANRDRVVIGSMFRNGGRTNNADATIDEVAVYDTPLSEYHIKQHYGLGKGYDLTTYEGNVLTDSPLLYWPLDESAGPTAKDLVGNNTGTYGGSPAFSQSTPDGLSNGVWFDAATDNVTDTYSMSSVRTIEFWLYITNWNQSWGRILHWESDFYIARYSSTSNLNLGKSGSDWDSGYALNNNQWYHITVTRSGSTLYLYVNGTYIGSRAGFTWGTSSTLVIGDSAGEDTWFKMSDFAIYDTQHTIQQIVRRYHAGHDDYYPHAIYEDNPVNYWKLDETTGTTATDVAGDYDGTYTNTPTLGQTGLITSGSSVLLDDTSSEYIDLGLIPKFTGDFTIEQWFKPDDLSSAIDGRLFYYYDDVTANGVGLLVDGNLDTVRALTWGLTTDIDLQGSISVNQTYHVVLTRSGSSAALYLNGVEIDSGAIGTEAFTGSTYTARLGIDRVNQFPFSGTVDELSLYHHALTLQQVQDHYIAGGGTFDEISEIPAASIAINTLVPQADDGASVGEQSNIPAGSIVISALAPTTVVTNESQVPAASIAITPIAPEWINSTQTYHDVVLADSPNIYWKMDETSGAEAFDSSGGGYDADYVGSPTLGQEPLTKDQLYAPEFTGDATQHIWSSASHPHNISGDCAIEFWTQLYDFPTAGSWYWFDKVSGFDITIDSNKYINGLGISNDPLTQTAADELLLYPCHVVFRVSSGTTYLYINNTLITSATADVTAPVSNLYVAGDDNGDDTIDGRMSNVAIYNADLSVARIGAHYTAGNIGGVYLPTAHIDLTAKKIGTNIPGGDYGTDVLLGDIAPVVYLPLDETEAQSPTQVLDYSGNDYHFTCVGSIDHDSTPLRLGAVDSCEMTSTTSHVVKSGRTIDLYLSGTIEFWFILHDWLEQDTTLFVQSNSGGSTGELDIKVLYATGQVEVRVGGTLWAVTEENVVTEDNRDIPKHFAVTWDETNGCAIYIDGQQNGTTSEEFDARFFSGNWYLGRGETTGEITIGTFSDLALYGSRLPPEDIQRHHDNSVLPGVALPKSVLPIDTKFISVFDDSGSYDAYIDSLNPTLWWKHTDTSPVSSVTDYSGSAYHGTTSGTEGPNTYTTNVPGYHFHPTYIHKTYGEESRATNNSFPATTNFGSGLSGGGSVSIWFDVRDNHYDTGQLSHQCTLFTVGDISIYWKGGSTSNLYLNDGTTETWLTNVTENLHHIVLIISASFYSWSFEVYKDGNSTAVASGSLDGGPASDFVAVGDVSAYPTVYVDFGASSFEIYDFELSTDQIRNIWAYGINPPVEVFQSDLTAASIAITDYDPGATSALDSTCSLDTTNSIPITTYTFTVDNVDLKESDIPTEQIDVTSLAPTATYTDLNHNVSQYFNQQNVRIEPTELEVTNGADKAYYNNLFNNLHDLYRYHLSDIPTEEEVSGTALTYNGTTGHIAQAGTIVAGSSSPSLNFSGGACLVDSRSVFDDSSNSINVTFWFRPTTDGGTTGAYNTDGQGLVCGNAASALSDFYVIWWNSQVHVKVGAETVVSTACTLNESHLVSVSYSSTGGLIVSVDGVEESNTTLVAGTALTSHTSVVIGKKVPADSNGFQGYIQYLGIGSDFVESNTPADYQIRYHASLWDTGKYFDDSGFINRQSKHIYSRSNRFYNAHHYLPLDDSAAPLTDVASGLTPTLTGTPTYQANADIVTFDSTVMLMPESSSVQIELDLPYETSFDDDHVETIFAGGWFKFEDVFQEAGTHAGQITLINVRNTHGAGDLEFKIVVDPVDQEIRWLFQEIGGSSVSGATKANWRPGVWTYLGIGYHNNQLYSYYQGNLIDTSNNINITEGDHNWKEVLYQNYGESDGGASWRRYRTKAAHLSVSYELPTTEQLSEIYDSVYTQEGLDYEVVDKLQANYDLFPLQEGQATGLVNSGYGDQRKLGSFTGTPTFTNAGPIYGMTDHAVTLATASAEAFVMEDEQDSTWSTSLVQFMIKIDSWTGTGECDIVRMDGGTNGYQLVLKRVASQNQVYLTDEAGNTSPAVDITLGQWMFLAVGCMPDPSTYHYILWINGGRKATTTTAPTQESFPTYTIGDTVGGANGWNGDISLVGTTHPLNWDQNHYEDYVYIQRTNRYWEELVDDWWENIFPLNTTTSTPDFLIKQGTASFVGTYTVDYEDGPMGDGDRAVRFHGANSYLQIDVSPDDQDFYCFAAWMKFNQLDDTNQWLITNGHSQIRMYVTDTNEIEGFPVVNNQWYHVVFQQYYDGDQWVQTWIDGVLVDTKSLGVYGGGATQIRFGSIGSGTNTDVSVSWASARDDKFDWNTDVPNITALYEAAINPTGFALPESLDNETVVHTAEIIPFPETQQWIEQPPEGVDLPASVIALTEQANTWDTTENHLISMSLQSIDLTTLTPTATGSDVAISALDVAAVTFGSLNPGTTKTEHRWTNMTAAPIVLSEQSQTWTSLNYMQSDLGVNNIPFSELAPGTTYTEHNLVGINYLEIEITSLDQRLNRTENNWSELSAPAIEVLAQAPEADYSANRWSDVNALNIQITEQNQEFNTTEHHQILLDEKNIPILHPRMDATVSRDTDGREVFCYTLSVGSYSPMTSYIEQSRSYTLHIGTKMSEDLEIARRDEFMASVGRKWRIQDN